MPCRRTSFGWLFQTFFVLHSQKWVIHIDPPIVVKLIVTNHPRELSRPGWKHLNPRFMSSILQHRICSIDSRAPSPIETNQTWESYQTSSNIPTFSILSQIFPRFSWQFPVVRSTFSLHPQLSVVHQVMAPFASVPIVVRLVCGKLLQRLLGNCLMLFMWFQFLSGGIFQQARSVEQLRLCCMMVVWKMMVVFNDILNDW